MKDSCDFPFEYCNNISGLALAHIRVKTGHKLPAICSQPIQLCLELMQVKDPAHKSLCFELDCLILPSFHKPSFLLSAGRAYFFPFTIRFPFFCFMVFDTLFTFPISFAAFFSARTFICFDDPHFYLHTCRSLFPEHVDPALHFVSILVSQYP